MFMNIASFLIPKSDVAWLYEDFTLRQALEKIRHHGYSAIPVLTSENKYVCTISEGDFLWYLIENECNELHKVSMKSIENMPIKDVIREDKNPPVRITATIEELLTKSINQNFIPVIDDRDYFIGIITRKDIIIHFYNNSYPMDLSKISND
jgi:CBS domain-containing protein